MHDPGMGHPPSGDRTKGAAMKTYLRLLRQLRSHLTLLLAIARAILADPRFLGALDVQSPSSSVAL